MDLHPKTTNATVAKIVNHIQLPKMVKVRQNFCADQIIDIPQVIRSELGNKNLLSAIRPGQQIAITAGSREIANIVIILKELVSNIKQQGGIPFIVPAMGSHGGATAPGQREVLTAMGITAESVGAPIKASMEVVQLTTSPSGLPVYMDKNAYEADATVVVARVKQHTSFRAPVESGMAKMIAVGLGKRDGAEICHAAGVPNIPVRVQEIAATALPLNNVIFALGIVENAYDQTLKISAVPAHKILEEEPALLQLASANMPQILFERCDVLVVDEAGKNIAGTGMDPNVIRRNYVDTLPLKPLAQRLALLDLTDKSHGNANGMTNADVCTERFFNKIDFSATYPNPLTNGMLQSCRIPVVMKNDLLAIQAAIKGCFSIDHNNARIIRIKNTLHVGEMLISENLLEEASAHPDIEIIGGPQKMIFDNCGKLISEI